MKRNRIRRDRASQALRIHISALVLALAVLIEPVSAQKLFTSASGDIISPAPGAVVTQTPLKVTIKAPSAEDGSFAVKINGKVIDNFTDVENGRSSALLRRRNLRLGQNTLAVVYAHHETSSVQFTYAPQAAPGLLGAEPSSPDYLRIQTRVVGGAGVNPGDYYTQVGSTRYVAPDGNGVSGFHVVALDRGEGSLKFNIVVPSEAEPFPMLAQQIAQQAVKNCTGPWGCILIISSMQTIGITPCPDLPKAQCSYSFDPGASMASLGGTFRINFVDGSRTTNAYSMITTIGQYGQSPRSSGEAYERLACESSSGCLVDGDAPNVWTGYGDITGALVGDNNNALTFTPTERATFSLHATPNAGDINTITVNGEQYSASLGGASGGFHVLILDASYLGVTFNYALPATPSGLATLVNGVGAYLSSSGATQNILVFVASMGSLDHSSAPQQWLQVAELFSRLGGTYHLIAGLKTGDDYCMIGAPATQSMWAPVTPAVESSSVVTRYASSLTPLPPTQLLGFLKKNNFGYYRPGGSDLRYDTSNTTFSDAANSIENALLDKTGLKAPIPWPICTNCTSTDGSNPQVNVYQAISYYLTVIGSGSGTPDIRTIYPLDEGSAWSQYQSNLTNLTMPGLQSWLALNEADKPYLANFSSEDFSTVETQLAAELGYLVLIHGYATNLASAVNSNETNLEFEIRNMYDELASELQVDQQSQSQVEADIMNAIVGGLSIASYSFGFEAAPVVNLGLDAASVTLAYSMSLNNTQSGVPTVADQLRSTVAALEVDTNSNFSSSLESMVNMFSLIYEDWGRMQTLGAALANNPEPLIQWTTDTANSYVKATAKSMGRQYVGAFFGALYNVYVWRDLTSGAPPSYSPDAICNAEGVSGCQLANHFNNSDWLNVRDQPNGQVPSSSNDGSYWNVLLMAKNVTFDGQSYGCFEGTCLCKQDVGGSHPTDAVMQEIFAPIGTYSDQINLGIYPPWFFTRYGIAQQPFFSHSGCTRSE